MNEIASKSAYYARIAQYASNEFNTIYLGAKDTAPTVDNDGNTLIVGALYFNTVTDIVYAWDGTIWISAIAGANTATTDTNQTITGVKTFTQPIIGDLTGNVTGNITGNATTATTLAAARTFNLSGDVTGIAQSFNGSANIVIPSTITNDAVTTPKIQNLAVTVGKLGTNEQKQICKAWVNFNGAAHYVNANGPVATSFVTTNGSQNAVWNISADASAVGIINYIPSIGGVSGATLGGVNVATVGYQVVGVNSASQYAIKLLAGPATSSQTVNGNGTSSGYTFSSSGIRSSYNVSSITKISTGDYLINFQTPMVDANYSITASGYSSASEIGISIGTAFTNSINYAQLRTILGPSLHDFINLNAQIFGN
jgi:hypothetical protein